MKISTLVTAGTAALAAVGSASADTANGQKVFRKCQACHSLEPGQNKVGPSLHGIMGQPAGQVEGFTSSDALANAELVWNDETMREWLRNPRAFVKGTKMAFPGLKKDDDIADVIEYIREASN